MGDPTPAEIEAGAAAADEVMCQELPAPHEVAEAVLRAVLPGHDARVRAEVAEAVAELRPPNQPEGRTWERGWYDACTAAIHVARYHDTGGDHD